MNDRNLQKRVEAELDWEPRINAAEIGVSVDKGVVTLNGAVGTYAEKINAEAAAMRVKGVMGIAEDIQVRPFGDIGSSDDEIAKRARNSLEWDTMTPDKQIQVQVEKGAVTLTGEVDWDFERTSAKRVVQHLYGVRSVVNKMTLKSRVQPEDIHRRIQDALERQGQINAGDVHVTVDGGKVRLDGKVEAWRDRRVIERAAWGAPGVYTVEDKVVVGF